MKERADVVVIGAGIVGCSAAYYLTQAGLRNVVVIDQGPIGDTGGSSVPRPRPVLPDQRLEALVHARAVVAGALSRARHARAAHLVGGRLARGRHHAGAARRARGAGTPTRRRGVSRAMSSAPTRRCATARCSTASRCTARCTSRATASRRAPTSARRCRSAPRTAARRSSATRARPASTWPAGACAPSRPTRARSPRRPRSSALGLWAPEFMRSIGLPVVAMQPMQHLFAWTEPLPELAGASVEIEHPILRHQDRAMYFRQRGDGYGIGAYGHDPITIEPHELERHPRRTPDRDGAVLAGALARVAGLGARAAAAARRRRHRRDVQRALLVRGRQQLVRGADVAGRRPLAGRRHLGHARAAAPRRRSSTS